MVQLIFEKYALGNWSTHSLEQFLWECGYRNYKGGRIDSHVIANIIRNPKYKGYYVGGKVKIVDLFTKKQKFLPEDEWVMYKDDGTHVPAIVDEKLWEDANRILEERSKNIKLKKTSYKQDNLFTGLIHCGAAYWLKVRNVRGKAAKTWVCSHRIKQGAVSCRSKPVKEEILLEAEHPYTKALIRAVPRFGMSYEKQQPYIADTENEKMISVSETHWILGGGKLWMSWS